MSSVIVGLYCDYIHKRLKPIRLCQPCLGLSLGPTLAKHDCTTQIEQRPPPKTFISMSPVRPDIRKCEIRDVTFVNLKSSPL